MTATLTATAMIALGAGAAPSLAGTGSVYWDGSNNVAAGQAFFNAGMTGHDNIGLDYWVMPHTTTGSGNTEIGSNALFANRGGNYNVASGMNALTANTGGNDNVASGHDTMYSNSTGNYNVASGHSTLFSNTTGIRNVASGNAALVHNTTGSSNVAIGPSAGGNLTTGSNNVDIANSGVAGESGAIRIGTLNQQTAAFLQGVYGKSIGGPTKSVVVNSAGRLGTATAAAAPLKAQSQTLSKLRTDLREQRVKNRHQSSELRQQGAAIRRLREQVAALTR